MTNPGRTSEPCLEIRISAGSGDPIEVETADGKIWRRDPAELPESLRTDALWERLRQDWAGRRGILTAVGAELGKWLFPAEAAADLRRRLESRCEGQAQLRVELRVPRERAGFPWEIAALEGIQHLAIHPHLTVVRVSDRGEQQHPPLTGQVAVHLIGVELESEHDQWPHLDVRREVERIRQAIASSGNREFFSVEEDVLGKWQSLADGYIPPHVFHFAGHGLVHGRGLVFRGTRGEPREVSAEKVANVLLGGRRRTRLAFLNACTTSAPGKGPFQPFGGLADQLIQQRIPMVVGLQAPVNDSEAQVLVEVFYKGLARGDGLDCALQDARTWIFRNTDGVGWAFLNLHVSGQPVPLFSRPTVVASVEADDVLLTFGHEDQRQRLSRFLNRKDPTVIVVHGEEGSAHRHVLKRIRVDIERSGNVLWRPVAELRWSRAGHPRLLRAQLAAGIAHSLALPDDGSPEQLEPRIAERIADRTENCVLVIDLVDVLTFQNPQQAQSFLILITKLWGELMHRAVAYRRTLPVFLLASVAYPRCLLADHRKAQKAEEIRAITEDTVAELRRIRRLPGNTRLEILSELKPFEESYVADFLEDTLSFDRDRAETVAANMVGLHDNERILSNLRDFLRDLEA